MKPVAFKQIVQTQRLEQASSLLFVGVLLLATLLVPATVLTTRWVVAQPAPLSNQPMAPDYKLDAAEQKTLRPYQHTTLAPARMESSGRHCSASSALGADSIFTGLCTETAT